jgi:hypothetical protein
MRLAGGKDILSGHILESPGDVRHSRASIEKSAANWVMNRPCGSKTGWGGCTGCMRSECSLWLEALPYRWRRTLWRASW